MAYHFGVPVATGTALVPLVPLPLPFFLLGEAERSGAERSAAQRVVAKNSESKRIGVHRGNGAGLGGAVPGCRSVTLSFFYKKDRDCPAHLFWRRLMLISINMGCRLFLCVAAFFPFYEVNEKGGKKKSKELLVSRLSAQPSCSGVPTKRLNTSPQSKKSLKVGGKKTNIVQEKLASFAKRNQIVWKKIGRQGWNLRKPNMV